METQDAKLKSRSAHTPGAAQARPGLRRLLQRGLRSGKIVALLMLVGAGWLLYDAIYSGRYVVRAVTTEGNTALTAQDVQALAAVEGQSIWYVRDAEIEARVRQSPYVERVQAQVVLPDRVVVRVTERRPNVRWTHDGTTYAVTEDGLVLAGTPPAPEAGATQPLTDTTGIAALTISDTATISETQANLPGPAFVSSISILDTTPNRPIKPGDVVDRDALEVARRVTLRADELPAPIQRIEWDAGLGVSLIVGNNQQAVIGKSDRLDEKLAILAQLLRENTAFTFLDLRPKTPYYR